MSRFDYSKWDNMDIDSEREESPPRPTPTPKADISLASDSIQAVIVRCDLERTQSPSWSATTIPANHAIFSQSVAPVPRLIEVPLVFYRVGTQSANRADLDNQIITYMNIDAVSGFAPPEWASSVGTVIVARKNRKPLLPQHLEGVWMYCDYILDLFGEGERAPTRLYNRRAFQEWWERYCEQQKKPREGTDGEGWQSVKSPYEV
ncbi:hypothetical protein F4859DRAFT_250653 [Xylaria cf. heliscus]|nr:hypothetical protein F4859DRAFT_250653 [Xylaria cf. heliscus]